MKTQNKQTINKSGTKVLLIPPNPNPFYKKNRERFMPLGLLSLAAVAIQNNLSVDIYEPTIRIFGKKDYRSIAQDMLQNNPDLIGFSTWCTSYPLILLIAAEVKKLAKNVTILFGGPQATILPKKTLENFPFVDFVLTGEADYSFTQFVRELENSEPDLRKIPGLCYRNSHDDKIILNDNEPNVPDPADLPVPAYQLIPKQSSIKIDVGRGCPFHCTYCTTSIFFSKKFRIKPAEKIVSEMLELNRNFGVHSFEFSHDIFTLRKTNTMKLCNQLIELKRTQGLSFTWNCSARIDSIDREMLVAMKEAGCTSIFFGIESGSETIQKEIRKKLPLSFAGEIADTCREVNIEMHVSYIFGFPKETRSDLNLTLHNIIKMLLKGAHVQSSMLSFLPGTPLYEQNKNKLRYDGNFSDFSNSICTKEERSLIKRSPEIFSSFYFLPVSTINRDALLFLSRLVNKLSFFRNTFFLLKNELKRDFDNTDFLSLIQKPLKQMQATSREKPVELTIIQFLQKYISEIDIHDKLPQLNDVLQYEAYIALLKSLYTRWQLVGSTDSYAPLAGESQLKPLPVWKMITTRYKLEKVLPSENNWRNSIQEFRRGKFYYLLIASSEIRCQRIKISKKEMHLTNHIRQTSVAEYIESVKNFADKETSLRWLKKLRKFGVIHCTAA